jgi:outer membrane biogenesis lipoprotein LolB
MPRLALPLAVLLLAGCTAPIGRETGQRDSQADACRAEATRVVQWRDRGQLMRSDETESGRGTVTVAPYQRAENDRIAAQIERDRMVAACLRGAPTGTR